MANETMSGLLHNLWIRTADKADRDLLYKTGGRLYRLETALTKALDILDQLPSSDLADEVRKHLRDGDLEGTMQPEGDE